MNGKFLLWAVEADRVLELFAAPPALAERLRQITRDRFALAPPRQPKFGPLLRRAASIPHLPADQPTPLDAETLFQGRFVPPERLAASWSLLEAWLDELFLGASLSLTTTTLDQIDFDLARAGVSSTLCLRGLLRRHLDLPLTSTPGRVVGSVTPGQTADLRDAWAHHWVSLEPATARALQPVQEFLDDHAEWRRTGLVVSWNTPGAGQVGGPAKGR